MVVGDVEIDLLASLSSQQIRRRTLGDFAQEIEDREFGCCEGDPEQLPLHLVIIAAEKDAIDQSIEIPRVFAAHVGSDHLGEDVLAQLHFFRMSDGPAFSAIFGAGTDEPVVIPFIQFKRLDDYRIRKAIALNEWFKGSDRIYGLAVTLRDSAH